MSESRIPRPSPGSGRPFAASALPPCPAAQTADLAFVRLAPTSLGSHVSCPLATAKIATFGNHYRMLREIGIAQVSSYEGSGMVPWNTGCAEDP